MANACAGWPFAYSASIRFIRRCVVNPLREDRNLSFVSTRLFIARLALQLNVSGIRSYSCRLRNARPPCAIRSLNFAGASLSFTVQQFNSSLETIFDRRITKYGLWPSCVNCVDAIFTVSLSLSLFVATQANLLSRNSFFDLNHISRIVRERMKRKL